MAQLTAPARSFARRAEVRQAIDAAFLAPDEDGEPIRIIPAGEMTLGPDGLTDVERQRKTIRDSLNAELSHDDEGAVWDLTLAISRALHAMPRYSTPPVPDPALTTALEEARRATAAYEALRVDVITAAKYIERQRSANLIVRMRASRRRILRALSLWVKDPGPLAPPASIRGLLEHVGINTTGRCINVAAECVDHGRAGILCGTPRCSCGSTGELLRMNEDGSHWHAVPAAGDTL